MSALQTMLVRFHPGTGRPPAWLDLAAEHDVTTLTLEGDALDFVERWDTLEVGGRRRLVVGKQGNVIDLVDYEETAE